jgi:septum formation protein
LILASASERRRRLLAETGAVFRCVSPDVQESDCSVSTRKTVMQNAILKYDWAVDRFPDCAIIAADTAIDFEEDLIGKPADLDQAREQLRRFSGHTHTVLTGIVFFSGQSEPFTKLCESPVTFRTLTEETISSYFDLVNPLDKAGSYDIGSHGELIVEGHEGSFTNIIGLPMEEITPLLRQYGFLR